MKPMSRLFNILMVILFMLSLSLQSFQPASAQPAQSGSQEGGVVRTGHHQETGKVSFIGADPAKPINVRAAQAHGLAPQARAMEMLIPYAAQFGLKNARQELTQKSTHQEAGRQVTRYQQTYQGIPVMGGELAVNATSGGGLLSINGEIAPDLNLATKPTISAEDAQAIALQSAAKWYQLDESELETSQPALWIYDSRLLNPDGLPASLVWRMEVHTKNPLVPVNELVLVDAGRGGIRLHFSQIDNAAAAPSDVAAVIEPLPAKGVVSESRNPVNPSDGEATWYVAVAPTGDDDEDCQTTLTPCATINAAIGKASDGDTIYVAGGIYTNSGTDVVLINKSLTLGGGWDSTFTSQPEKTVIDGENLRRGIKILSGTITIDRFEIVNGEVYGFTGAPAGATGGGIYMGAGTNVTIQNSSIHNNFASGGGGIRATSATSLTIINTTIGDNTANDGGGIYLQSTNQLTLKNVTIYRNHASSWGGGIYRLGTGTTITMQNSILAGNTASTGGRDCYGAITSNGYNLVKNTANCSISSGSGDILGQDPMLGKINALGVYGLLLQSPAIDTGNPAVPGSDLNACELTDQVGNIRPIDGDENSVAYCDIGAYETNPPLPSTTSSVSVNDGYSQFAEISTTFAVQLSSIVMDQYGDPVSGITVTFVAPASGASGTFNDSGTNTTTATSNASGVATAAAFTANDTVGNYMVDASISGVATPARFQLENIILAPTTISYAAGSPQTTQINTVYATQFKAEVRDQFGDPFQGATVTFTAPSSGASGTFSDSGTYTTTAITNASGYATAATFTANGNDGIYIVEGSVSGVATPITFQMNNWTTHIWYVSNTGNDSNNCFTPATPCANIRTPLAKPVFREGEVIYVETGTYIGGPPSFVVDVSKSVSILGGWNSDFTAQTGYSTIDADSAYNGIRFYSSGVVITNSLDRFILSNSTSYGLQVNNATINVTNTIIQNGAGVGAQISLANATLTNVSIHNNAGNGIAIQNGSAIYNITIMNSAIYNNGDVGLYNSEGNVTVKNSTISGNVSSGQGGGIYTFVGLATKQLSLDNVTVSGNRANMGGGIYSGNGKVILKNTLIANNSAVSSYPDCRIPSFGTSQGYNLIGNNSGCTFTPTTGDQANVSLFILPLADYGGPTFTHALLKNSLAVDAGNPATPGSGGSACESTDQRGVTRPAGSACDIGAFEYFGPGTTPAYLYFYQGSPQSILANGTATVNFQTVVLDANGSAVPGETVTFTAPVSGPSGTFSDTGTNVTTALADANGIATASNFTTNALLGQYEVQATVDGVASPIVFDVSNTIPASTYAMNYSTDENNLPGAFVCNQAQPACSGGSDPDADRAQQYAIGTHVFYLNHHDRDSIDNAGMEIVSSVHFGLNYANAFWTGTQAVYGEGYPNADDVVAHELTHGVTQYESDLLYYYQSGAINESLSDVWGELYDQSNGLGTDTPTVKWQIGEDLPGGALRSMSNPTIYSDPDAITSANYYTGNLDSGGVHTNSGVNNKAAYLLVDGDTFNDKTVTALGADKTLAIYYEAQTNLLTSGADYADLYNVLYQACLNVAGGPDGVLLADCQEVRDATDAVRMNSQPASNPNFNTDAPVCSAGLFPQQVFFDDLEAGTANWTFNNGSYTRWQYDAPYGSYAHSGLHFLYADDWPQYSGSPTDARATLNSTVLPANAYLYFYHAYDFEQYQGIYYDGGVIEYSTNGGSTWIDASPLINYNSYKGQIYPDWNNPLKGRYGFVGSSHGYISTRLNLSSLGGQTVKFRWRMGLDDSSIALGWFVDDVRIYTCSAATISGNVGAAGVTLSYTDGVAKTATSLANGSYSFTVSNNWSGTVTPAKACYIFDPLSRSYSNVLTNQTAQNYTFTLDPGSGCAHVTVLIGENNHGSYGVPAQTNLRQSYSGVNNGPMKTAGTNSLDIIPSTRVLFGGVSYSELMGYPADQLTNEYIFPYYNNVAFNSQLRVGNLGAVPTTITVTLGTTVIDSYTLGAGLSTRKNYAGQNDGPLRVSSSATDILTTTRVLYSSISYSELMGYPVNQLTDEYIFPYYNNVALNSQLRVSNLGAVPTTITVTLGNTVIDTYVLAAGGATRKNYAGKNSGPLRVSSSTTDIISTIRALYNTNSYSELMGYPVNQLTDEYWYPVYDNVSLDSQLRVSNVGAGSTTITVYSGGTLIDTYSLAAGAATRKNYAAENDGPLQVVSSAESILSTIRMLYLTPSFASYYEMTGFPGDQLTTDYRFPWYNNVAFNTEVRFAAP